VAAVAAGASPLVERALSRDTIGTGIVALALVGGVVFVFVRRRRRWVYGSIVVAVIASMLCQPLLDAFQIADLTGPTAQAATQNAVARAMGLAAPAQQTPP